ncbi:hypothetical protein [Nocardiopsis halophila]|uniref:hypothetical protein n=1 Tax=Nocardiopsis halophila TaxID=141692 RepID=UPI00036E1876|nr:hypothetical protein [Nocardiopsis halophila]
MYTTTPDGGLSPRPFPFTVTLILLVGLAVAALFTADPKVFKLRSRSSITYQADVDIYQASRREWRIREKLDHAHSLGYLSEGRYRKHHAFADTLMKNLDRDVEILSNKKVLHMQQLRNFYYAKIMDPVEKLDSMDRKVDRFLTRKGIDPKGPEHPWNREKRSQEAGGASAEG